VAAPFKSKKTTKIDFLPWETQRKLKPHHQETKIELPISDSVVSDGHSQSLG
jgi:hypothetical protein